MASGGRKQRVVGQFDQLDQPVPTNSRHNGESARRSPSVGGQNIACSAAGLGVGLIETDSGLHGPLNPTAKLARDTVCRAANYCGAKEQPASSGTPGIADVNRISIFSLDRIGTAPFAACPRRALARPLAHWQARMMFRIQQWRASASGAR